MDAARPNTGRGRGRGRGGGTSAVGLGGESDGPSQSQPTSSSSSGRSLQRTEGDKKNTASILVSKGRGRGRGVFARDFVAEDTSEDEDERPSLPSAVLSREREEPSILDRLDESDSDDDFESTFRKMHPAGAMFQKPISVPGPLEKGISGLAISRPGSSSSAASSSSSLAGVGMGRGRGRGQLLGVLSGEPGGIIKRPNTSGRVSPPGISPTSISSKVPVCANFMKVKIMRNMGLHEYHVDFNPEIESRRLKRLVLKNSEPYIGQTFTFDGAKLYIPWKLGEKVTKFAVPHPSGANDIVDVRIKYIKQNSLDDCTHFYNVLLKRVMERLGYMEMQRNFYDYQNTYNVDIHKLEIWPGFVTAVDLYEGGLMLCCDSSFKVLRQDTMMDALHRFENMATDPSFDYHHCQDRFREYALGKIVLTKYNQNRHYRIDDIAWDKTPMSTFPQTRGGITYEVSFKDYYRTCYGIEIQDLKQPLLVSRGKPKRQVHTNDFTPPQIIMLIPELCFVTGMTEEITSDYRIMKTIAERTRIPPHERVEALQKFIYKVNSENANGEPNLAKKIFTDWGLELDSGIVSLNGRVIGAPAIILGRNAQIAPQNGDFSKDLLKCNILEPVPVSNWVLVCTNVDMPKAERLIKNYASVAPPLGIPYRENPEIVKIARGTSAEFRHALVNHIIPDVTKFVVAIIPSARDDIYGVVKIICNKEIPVPSQVMRSKTLTDEKKIRSVMQKVALQINCKLGGALWTIKIPLQETIMFLGMDVYHDPKRRNASVTAVVASINQSYTKYYSRVIFQSSQQETISSLRPVMKEALQSFYEENNAFPDRVIMFRDGVGDGQLNLTREHEVKQMTTSFAELDIRPKFTFCVVQKRINARMFLQHGSYVENPVPGTVVDHTITRRYHYDFFLVSQLIREGTVNPTHYIVLHDDANMSPDMMQKFAYATSYMYYNWAGSIRVPAMCHYAHKAAGLVGQHLRTEPSIKLATKLYYL